MADFSKSEAIGYGWQTTKQNLGFFIPALLIAGVAYVLPQSASKAFEDSSIIAGLIGIAGAITQMVIDLGLIKISLKFVDNQKPEFNDLLNSYSLFFKYLVSTILFGLIVIAGFLLLIIPGIIFGIKLQYYSYFIVDTRAGPIEALKKSWEITSGVKLNLFVFGILLGLISALGALALLVGLLVAIPVVLLANAYVYRELLRQSDVPVSPAPSPTPESSPAVTA